MTTTAELRQLFLDFFAQRDHEVVSSSSLVPGNDKTLLFTNAGMVQFKDVFTGDEKKPYVRATTSQRCVRAGGKHNDLENVGYTARHHTFFEMLGNFSFGDYFKTDAITYAWEFLTEVVDLPEEKLWVTVFEEDDEAEEIWLKQIGVPKERVLRIGAKDNFWSMGDTGPCGPCSEIFYDHGPDVPGGPPGTPEEDGDRYIEIWNLVFMQFNKDADGSMEDLPKPSVDTGMGLERLAAILQGKHNNYEIDLFEDLVGAAAKATGCEDINNKSLRVIADHIRSCAFLIVDGVLPSNEGRGYVLRRIIRRAARHAHQLGQTEPFFHTLVADLDRVMGEAYPELRKLRAQVEKVLLTEEQRFAETLHKGMQLLRQEIETTKGKTLSGKAVFKLYDTYGFPVDLTADVAREHNLEIDLEQFDQDMAKQKELARSGGNFTAAAVVKLDKSTQTDFTGYERVKGSATVTTLLKDNQPVTTAAQGDEIILVSNATPFYGEAGGQVGDTGWIKSANGLLEVIDTQKQGDAFLHIGTIKEGELAVNDNVELQIDVARREFIKRNHSATHLMHKALRDVLGEHVQQKGSLVNEQLTRFDFAHFEPMTDEQIKAVEDLVNQQIQKDSLTEVMHTDMESAKAAGAMALFGEKYGEEVRVVSIGFSTELCGGVHVDNVTEIELFRMGKETGVAAGVRRVSAYTSDGALQSYQEDLQAAAAKIEQGLAVIDDNAKALAELNAKLEADSAAEQPEVAIAPSACLDVADGMITNFKDNGFSAIEEAKRCLEGAGATNASLQAFAKTQQKELQRLQSKLAASAGGDLSKDAVEIAGVQVVAANLAGADPKSLRDTVDQLKNKLGNAAIVIAAVNGSKVSLCAGVTKAESKTIKAGELVNFVANQVGGKGGGRPDMAQAGGDQPENLEAALASVADWIKDKAQS